MIQAQMVNRYTVTVQYGVFNTIQNSFPTKALTNEYISDRKRFSTAYFISIHDKIKGETIIWNKMLKRWAKCD